MSNQYPPLLVSFKPLAAPTRHLAVCTNKSRALGEDYDVRCIQEPSIDTYFILEQINEKVFKIKSAAKPFHYLFCSNDNTRKLEDDFDVRTHQFNENRNNWIIENIGWSVYTIRSETNPDYYLFVANDKSNHLDKDLDVRTQKKELDNNHWYIITIPNYVISHPLKYDVITVKLRPAHQSQHYLTIGNHHKTFTDDLSVCASQNNNENSLFQLDRIEGETFSIRSAQIPSFYLFPDNKKEINQWKDFDVRLHPHKELRNNWFIESAGDGLWTIRSVTNIDQYLFGVQDQVIDQTSFAIRTHPFIEERNKWIIEGFQG